MDQKILVAGGTGNLGSRIINALIEKEAMVYALVREGSDQSKIEEIEKMGAQVISINMTDMDALTKACDGISCVVSALAGLHEVIVDSQSLLLGAAIAAGVPRFIPSDFSSDFTKLPAGENRNFDLRKEFHDKLDKAAIASTSIFNGAFTDILGYNTPFFNQKNNTIGYWGSPDYKVDFTTMDNTAAYTAAVALDPETPRILRIASFQISANELSALVLEVKNKSFKLVPMGNLAELSVHNKKKRAAHPEGENELYPSWQGSQYMHSMFSVQNQPLDNNRYPGINWTTVNEILFAL
ncbi:MAG: NmrA family NAD(P)-binding protein [Ferruginibacter sp.]